MPTTEDEVAPAILLVDKPAGPTSHDLVDRARRVLGTRRVGHTGTLDPFASGLLILCLGAATRLVRFFHPLPKSYRASVRLGLETETHDEEGAETSRSTSWRDLGPAQVESAIASLRGRISQRPPRFSAKRVSGERAHRLARAGEEVELDPVEVTVHRLTVRKRELPDLELEARVSSGTYVRALARDLGRELGCGAHLRALRRIRIGPLGVERAWPGVELDPASFCLERAKRGGAWLSAADALSWLPRRILEPGEAVRVRHGGRVPLGRVSKGESARSAGERESSAPASGKGPGGADAVEGFDGEPVLLLHGEELVAVAETREDELQPRVVLGG